VLSGVSVIYLRVYQEFIFISYHELKKERMYWEGRGRISKLKNSFIHESVLLQPITILKIIFWNLKIFILSGEFPHNNKP